MKNWPDQIQRYFYSWPQGRLRGPSHPRWWFCMIFAHVWDDSHLLNIPLISYHHGEVRIRTCLNRIYNFRCLNWFITDISIWDLYLMWFIYELSVYSRGCSRTVLGGHQSSGFVKWGPSTLYRYILYVYMYGCIGCIRCITCIYMHIYIYMYTNGVFIHRLAWMHI